MSTDMSIDEAYGLCGEWIDGGWTGETWVHLPDGTRAILWVPASEPLPAGHAVHLVPIPDKPGVCNFVYVKLQ